MKTIIKHLLTVIAITMLCFNASALEHVVKRGETIESIANTYGISVSQLKDANPGVDNLFFIGLKLNIPESRQMEASAQNYLMESAEGSPAYNSNPDYRQEPGRETAAVGHEELSSEKFSNGYVSYMANVNDFGLGYYGLGWVYYGNSGFGTTCSLHGNWGIAKKGNLQLMFGPIYGMPMNDNVLIGAQLKGVMGTYDGFNKKDGREEVKLGGGMYFMPNIELRAGKISLTVGYNLGWLKYEGKAEFAHNLHLAIGYAL